MFKKLLLTLSTRLLAGSGEITKKITTLIAEAETKNLPGADKYQWVYDQAKTLLVNAAPHVVETIVQNLVTLFKTRLGA